MSSLFERDKKITSAVLLIADESGNILVQDQKGGLTQDTLFVTASVTKLFTHALAFQLIDKGELSYDTRIVDVLGEDVLDIPNASLITVRHLIDQTSGLADYETDRMPGGEMLMKNIFLHDEAVGYEKALELTKQMKPKFLPGEGKKAYYSNMNAELLCKILERITGEHYAEMVEKQIGEPLGLKRTRLLKSDEQHWPIYKGKTKMLRPMYISSGKPSGALVATNSELIRFLSAFMKAQLFRKHHIEDITFRPIQWFPVRYGAGMMQLRLPFPSLIPTPDMVGHSGSTGSFAYYVPSRRLFVCGTINQVESNPYKYVYHYLNQA